MGLRADSWADLSASVDVYADWVDACDSVAKGDGEEIDPENAMARVPVAGRQRPKARDEEDDDDLIDDADADEDGMGGYGGDGVVADDEY